MSHRYLNTYPLERPRPQLADPTLLARAVEKSGPDFPAVGAVLYAGTVAAA
jgi:hypothetical protein